MSGRVNEKRDETPKSSVYCFLSVDVLGALKSFANNGVFYESLITFRNLELKGEHTRFLADNVLLLIFINWFIIDFWLDSVIVYIKEIGRLDNDDMNTILYNV